MDKYGINFSEKARVQDSQRLINQLWKLIPMRENEEDWVAQLNVLLEEIAGVAELYRDRPESLILMSKLEGLTNEVCNDFMLYRKTIFRCIELLTKVLEDGNKSRNDA